MLIWWTLELLKRGCPFLGSLICDRVTCVIFSALLVEKELGGNLFALFIDENAANLLFLLVTIFDQLFYLVKL